MNTTGSGSILTILLIIFITLKLVGVIQWSWLWVLCPIWGPFALAIVVLIGVLILACFK